MYYEQFKRIFKGEQNGVFEVRKLSPFYLHLFETKF
jgi:hypothetical protein